MKRSSLIGVALALCIIGAGSLSFLTTSNPQIALAADANPSAPLDPNQSITASGQNAIKDAIAAVENAVVRIDVTATISLADIYGDDIADQFFRYFFGDPDNDSEQQVTAMGSGFLIDYEGETFALTNAHVIDSADTILVTTIDGITWPADVVGIDSQVDVAVLRLTGDTSALSTVELGNSADVEIGDWAIAIGNPIGLSYTVTLGIISALDRDVADPDGVGYYQNLIQTDAAINPGNSGGPLINAYGQVVGVNTMIAESSSDGVSIEGINFAVPINAITDILGQLVDTGKVVRAWLGVYIQDITPAMGSTFGVEVGGGVLVSDTVEGAPAEAAGILSGDVITHVDGQPVGTTDELIRTISLQPVGVAVDVTLIRNRVEQTIPVVLAEKPSEEELYGEEPAQTKEPEAALEATEIFGLSVGVITESTARQLGLQSQEGVVIIDVAPGEKGYWAGLRPGDVITAIDLQPVQSVDDWNEIVADLDEADSPTLKVIRNGQAFFVSLGG
ncbi:trypsin-like peptidase domain-containing protein [Candidatus Bipolaricaulota bacterium]|nr:trypsin-like peptidase domain-containing protein [Candidatus Bipolaricaulota bacterium]